MTVAIVAGVCVVLLVLAFLLPRLSRGPQRGLSRLFGAGGQAAGQAPGALGRWLRKPFSSSNRAVARSGSAGRRARSKLPL